MSEVSKNQEQSIDILLVDDETDVREAIRDMILMSGKELGINVAITEAVNGVDAIIKYTSMFRAYKCQISKPYDAVFTDFLMPDVHGIKISKMVKRISPRTQVCLISGNVYGQAYQELTADVNPKLLPNTTIAKPIQLDAIKKIVKETASKIFYLQATPESQSL